MSLHLRSVSDEYRPAHTGTPSLSRHSSQSNVHPSPPAHISLTTKRSSAHIHTRTISLSQKYPPSPLKMVTSTSSHTAHAEPSFYFLPAEADLHAWMTPTVIEDDDLMFGGKSLSAWLEEDREAFSPPEEERRGRQRVRQLPPRTESHHHTKSKPVQSHDAPAPKQQ